MDFKPAEEIKCWLSKESGWISRSFKKRWAILSLNSYTLSLFDSDKSSKPIQILDLATLFNVELCLDPVYSFQLMTSDGVYFFKAHSEDELRSLMSSLSLILKKIHRFFPLREGTLAKCTRHKKWINRYFVLCPRYLLYFYDESDYNRFKEAAANLCDHFQATLNKCKNVRGVISLQSATISDVGSFYTNEKKYYTFSVKISERVYTLSDDNRNNMIAWRNAIFHEISAVNPEYKEANSGGLMTPVTSPNPSPLRAVPEKDKKELTSKSSNSSLNQNPSPISLPSPLTQASKSEKSSFHKPPTQLDVIEENKVFSSPLRTSQSHFLSGKTDDSDDDDDGKLAMQCARKRGLSVTISDMTEKQTQRRNRHVRAASSITYLFFLIIFTVGTSMTEEEEEKNEVVKLESHINDLLQSLRREKERREEMEKKEKDDERRREEKKTRDEQYVASLIINYGENFDALVANDSPPEMVFVRSVFTFDAIVPSRRHKERETPMIPFSYTPNFSAKLKLFAQGCEPINLNINIIASSHTSKESIVGTISLDLAEYWDTDSVELILPINSKEVQTQAKLAFQLYCWSRSGNLQFQQHALEEKRRKEEERQKFFADQTEKQKQIALLQTQLEILKNKERAEALNQIPIITSSIGTVTTTTMSLETFEEIAQNGTVFIKHGKYGNPHDRKITVNFQAETVDWETGSIALDDVLMVVLGKNTEIFKGKDIPDKMCFSLITTKRSLDLQGKNQSDVDTWFRGLKALLHK